MTARDHISRLIAEQEELLNNENEFKEDVTELVEEDESPQEEKLTQKEIEKASRDQVLAETVIANQAADEFDHNETVKKMANEDAEYEDALAKQTKVDMVHSPPHYSQLKGVEPIQVIIGLNMSFPRGSAFRYIWRAGDKGNYNEDLAKAIYYLWAEIKKTNPNFKPLEPKTEIN